MHRWIAAALFLAGLSPAWGQALQITGELEVTGAQDAVPTLLRVGPLVPAGLVQEICSPLGYCADSEVFQEKSGFRVDLSAARPSGFVCSPGAAGFFCQPLDGGGVECGAFFNTAPRRPWRMAGVFWYSEPAASGFGEEWFRDTASFPGGSLLGGGGRFGVGISGLEAVFSLGVSAGDLVQPGWMAELDGRAATGPLEAALLIGACSAGYRTPAGEAAGAAWRASGRLRLSGDDSAAQLSAAVDVERTAFAPGRVIPMHQVLSLQIERSFPVGGFVETGIRLTADKRISFDARGAETEESSCSGRFTFSFAWAQTSLGLSWSADSGAVATARLEAQPLDWVRVALGVAWSDPDQACSVDITCAIRAGGALSSGPVPAR